MLNTKIIKYSALLILSLLLFGCDKDDATTLVVATSPDLPPFTFKKNEELCGIDIYLAKEIAKDSGKEIIIKEMPFDELLESVRAGRADIAIGTISITQERKQLVDFSAPYYKTGSVIFSPLAKSITSAAGLKGKSVGITMGAIVGKIAEDAGGITVSFSNSFDIADAIIDGKIDCAVSDAPMARTYIKDKESLAITSPLLTEDNYGIACSKDKPALLKKVNKTIKRLQKSNELQEQIDIWMRLADEQLIKH